MDTDAIGRLYAGIRRQAVADVRNRFHDGSWDRSTGKCKCGYEGARGRHRERCRCGKDAGRCAVDYLRTLSTAAALERTAYEFISRHAAAA